MKIIDVKPMTNYTLRIITDDGRNGIFDVSPYLHFEAFSDLKDKKAFMHITNGGYFIEWDCGADLSVDTIEAKWDCSNDQNVHQ